MVAFNRYLLVIITTLIPTLSQAFAGFRAGENFLLERRLLEKDLLADEEQYSFEVKNTTPFDLGKITLFLRLGTSFILDVPGTGTFETFLSSAPNACIIFGQLVTEAAPVRITIDAHRSVRATLQDKIVVFDDVETM